MRTQTFILTLLASPAVLAANPFSSSNFVDEVLQVRNQSLSKEVLSQKGLNVEQVAECSSKETIQDKDGNTVNCSEIPRVPFWETVSWVSGDINSGTNVFYDLAISPLGDSQNYSVGLYKGLWYAWGEKIKIPFYFSFAKPVAQSNKDEAAETLIDKEAGLQVNFPILFAANSGLPKGSLKQTSIVTGIIIRGVAKELNGENVSKYTYGYNASAMFQYNSYLEIFNVKGTDDTVQPGSLNFELNYTRHYYKDSSIKAIATDLELLESDKFSNDFTTYGITIAAELGKVVSLKYQWEKVDDPIFGTEKISRFVVSKSF